MTETPKVTLITGTSRGIGRALVTHYLEQGHMVVGCARGPSDLEHPRYMHQALDVSDEAAVKAVVAAVSRKFGKIDHLLNNAALASLNHMLTTPAETFVSLFQVNVLGSFLFARETAKLMLRKRFGRIVNFTTVAVPMRMAGEGAYGATKAAVEHLTAVLARELAPMGITVNAVGPGVVDTDLTRKIPADSMKKLFQKLSFQNYSETSDVANVTDFFLKPESRYVTGQIVYIGGP